MTTAAVLFAVMMFAPSVPAYEFSGDVHKTSQYVSSTSDVYWSNIKLDSGDKLDYKVEVTTYGAKVSVYFMTNSDLTTYNSGGTIYPIHNHKNITSTSDTYSASGTYGVLIVCNSGSAYCKVDITKTTAASDIFSNSMVCFGVILLGIIILVVIVVVVARRRSTPPVQPYAQQVRPPMGQTPPGYSPPQRAPQYQGYQGPPTPPAGYPQPAQSYQQPAQQYPQQQYPQQYPQAGYGAQPPASTMLACKYCGLQVPSNSNVCSRCGGRL